MTSTSTPTQKALIVPSKHAKFILSTIPKPTPAADEVLIKVHAVALNPVDWAVQQYGILYDESAYPLVLGYDIAGEVENVGEAVEGFKGGERVIANGIPIPSKRGGFQQYACASATLVSRIPSSMSYSQAATIPLGFTTAGVGILAEQPFGAALNPNFNSKDVPKSTFAGKTAVVIGGGTSVGQYAIQIFRILGFSTIITYASSHHTEYLKSLGATHVIDRKDTSVQDIPATVKSLSPEAPVPIVYVAFGGAEEQEAGLACLSKGGQLACATLLALTKEKLEKASEEDKRVFWVNLQTSREAFGKRRMEGLTRWLGEGLILPNRVEELKGGLEGIPDALERMKSWQVGGVKLVALPHETA